MSQDSDPALRLGIGFEGFDATDAVRRLEATGAGAVILFARNIRDASQTRDLIAEIRRQVPRPLLFCIDQEGGNVVRFTSEVTIFPGNMALGATDRPELAERQGRLTAAQLRAVGFNLNLAPVLDLARTSDNPGIGQRSFGAFPELAERMGSALVHGMQAGGLGATLKHFPGKGAATVDAHIDLPTISVTEAEHRSIDLLPFARLVREGVAAVMSSHVVYRAFGDELPATFSRRIAHELLREELNFDGLLTSDDMEMGAIDKNYGFEEAIVRCARAGHDLLFVCHTFERQVRAAELLREDLAAGKLDPAENQRAIERIERWTAPAEGELSTELWAEGDGCAGEIAARSICLLEDPHSVLPLRRDARTHVLFPTLRALVAVEEEIGAEATPFLLKELRARLSNFAITTFDLDPSAEEAEAIADHARDAEQVLLFTYNAAFLPEQAHMIQLPPLSGSRCVHIHLRNPFDQVLVRGRCAGVAAWGYRRIQIAASLAAVFGEAPFQGRAPVEI